MRFIPEHIIEQIKLEADLVSVITRHAHVVKKGRQFKGKCPFCGGDKFEFSEVKNIYKCHKGCGNGGTDSIKFIQQLKNLSFPEAAELLAQEYHIEIPQPNFYTPSSYEGTFCEKQLKDSGINQSSVRAKGRLKDENDVDIEEVQRYRAATVNERYEVVPGNDMVLTYLGLDGKIKHYEVKGGKRRPLIRVRFSSMNHPFATDRQTGKPRKYWQPPGSGVDIWITEKVRKKYKSASPEIDTLVLIEGEKKADSLCEAGIYAIGLMGINNLTQNKVLPEDVRSIMDKCKPKNVIFMVDADWLEIKEVSDKSVSSRPQQFAAAVKNFKAYFTEFNRTGDDVELYFGYLKRFEYDGKITPIPDTRPYIYDKEYLKGVDDFIVKGLKVKRELLLKDFEQAVTHPKGDGEYIQLNKITTVSDYRINELWCLHDKNQFAKLHLNRLNKVKEFKFGAFAYTLDENGGMQLADQLMPTEKFWTEHINPKTDEVSYRFDHVRCYNFLQNRGFFRVQLHHGVEFIKMDGSIVDLLKADKNFNPWRDYVADYLKELGNDAALNMIYRNPKYLGPESVSNLVITEVTPISNAKTIQHLCYKNACVKITDETVEVSKLEEAPGHVWANRIIERSFQYIGKPLFEVEQKEEGIYQLKNITKESNECHFSTFLLNASNMHWRTQRQREQLQERKQKEGAKFKPNEDEVTILSREKIQQEKDELILNYLSKVTAIGYLLHRYHNPNVLKAVACFDGRETEVGSSFGRSGKTILSDCIENLTPTVVIDGKRKDLADDKFLFDGVDETTSVVSFDDVRMNMDFEMLFPKIIGKWVIEKKGGTKYTLPSKNYPKILLTTNHMLRGKGGSFKDRMFRIVFSDYYNPDHRPIDDFGLAFFSEWDANQWNLFDNFAVTCVYTYLKHGLIQAPEGNVKKRELRQEMGEEFYEWADGFFHEDALNKKIKKNYAWNDFFETIRGTKSARYYNIRIFKQAIKDFCEYKGFEYNPHMFRRIPGGGIETGLDDKRCGVEWIIVADQRFDNTRIDEYPTDYA